MDTFDSLRTMPVPELTSHQISNSQINNGYHENNFAQNNTEYNPPNTENVNEKDFSNPKMYNNDIVEESDQQNQNVDLDTKTNEEISAEQPIVADEPEEKNLNVEEKVNGENNESDLSKTDQKEDDDDKKKEEVENEEAEATGERKSLRPRAKLRENVKYLEDDDDDDIPLSRTKKKLSSSRSSASKRPQRSSTANNKSNSSKSKSNSNLSSNKRNEINELQCRVCLVRDDLMSIFKTDGKISIADKLMTVCPNVIIARKDHLPQYICNTCMQSVQVAYNLKVLCETTDKDLRIKVIGKVGKNIRPQAPECIIIDAGKFGSDESDDNKDVEFNPDGSASSDAEEGGVRKSKRTKKKSRSTRNSTGEGGDRKRPRKESSSPEKRPTADFSSGSEDNYAPPVKKNTPKESTCPYCNEKLPSLSSLMRHKKEKHSNENMNCELCGKNFKLLAAFQAHNEKHKQDGDSLKCEKCEKTFTKLVEKKRHMIEAHNEKPETFPCEKCKRVFALKKSLERHLDEGKCPGPRPKTTPAPTPQKKKEMESMTLGRDLFKCVAPVTTTYWSDDFSD